MRILQVIPTLGSGGAESFVTEISMELRKRGETCDVLTLYDSSNSPRFNLLRDKNIEVYTLNKAKGFHVSILFRIIKFIRSHKYDVVHVHIGAIKYIFLASLLLGNTRFIATIHSEAKREAGRSIDRVSRKIMFKRNLCVPVTISDESEKSFEDFYGYSAAIIPNGVSSYREPLDITRPNNQIFIHPASCQPIKNQELLIEAFIKLTQDFPEAKLVWVGNSKMYPDLFASLSKKFNKNIEYLGESDNVRKLMSQADAICLSSKMEGLPMTIIEAFSVGCIPICTPVGGCKNIIKNGINGFLSPDMTVEGYYKILKQFCQLSPSNLKMIKENALKSFDAYSIEKCCKKYLALYALSN